MKVVQINTFPTKATGGIMMNIHKVLLEKKYDSFVVWGRGRKPITNNELSIYDSLGVKLHGMLTRLTDKTGFFSYRATIKLLKKLDDIKPDIIHIHNLHGYYVNINMLFDYIKKHNINVVMTLHDCWCFTGHCAYFDKIGCKKWINGCKRCPQKNTYPASWFIDCSKSNWISKRSLFSYERMTLVTPCIWLKDVVQKSFLSMHDIKVINNGIDLEVFKYRKSDFRMQYEINNRFMILGVASEWTDRKGFKDFIKLSEVLDDKDYVIVLVGLTKKQKKKIPSNIIGLLRTENIEKLVEIYSAADVYFNPTYEDNYPTTNIESSACGTTVITYNTGGAKETISHNDYVVDKGDIDSVTRILSELRNGDNKKCGIISGHNDFKMMTKEYIELYNSIC